MSVEVFLSSNPLALSDIIDTIRIQSRDEGGNPVFTDSQIKLAIRRAVIRGQGKFFSTESYDLSFTTGTFDYTLPNYIRRITRITRDRSTNGSLIFNLNNLSGTIPDETLHNYRHFYNRQTNTLSFTKDYPTCTMTIWYERDVQVPIDTRTLGAAIAAANTVAMTLVDANPQLANLALPAYFQIDNEIIKISAFSSNTACTIARGQFSTTAVAHDNGKTLSQVLVAESDAFYDYLFAESGRLLNQMRVQSGNVNVSVAANITAARMFKEDVEDLLKEVPQQRKQRRMTFSRDRRPRRI